jgi:hypothetical protein
VIQIVSYWGWVTKPPFIPIHSERTVEIYAIEMQEKLLSLTPCARAYVQAGFTKISSLAHLWNWVIITGSVDEV